MTLPRSFRESSAENRACREHGRGYQKKATSYVIRTGKTPVLAALEARALLDSIDTTTVVGLRDRALIGLLGFTFARIGAALGMTVVAAGSCRSEVCRWSRSRFCKTC